MSNLTTTKQPGWDLNPTSMNEAMEYANLIASSGMVPKDYQNAPANVLIAIQMGNELGLKPMQSLQGISVVNGRPAVWGDSLRALILSADDLITMEESFDDATMTAKCTIKRKTRQGGEIITTKTFSKANAELAGLWGRNTWKQYPTRMLQMRAFGFAARDAYADRLRGIQLAEEVQDIPPEREINPAGKQSSSNLLDIHKQAQGGANKSNPDDDKGDPDIFQESESQEQSGTMEFTLFDQIEVELDECQSEDRLKMIGDSIADHKQAGDISDQQASELRTAYTKASKRIKGA